MSKRRRRRNGHDWFPLVAMAFGVGLLLAIFCQFKVIIFLAGLAIIILGLSIDNRC